MRRTLALVLFVAHSVCAWTQTGSIELRVGVTEYQNIDRIYESYLHFFHDVAIASNSRITFSVAVGTYDEVLKWRDQGEVDLAVLSAGPVATLLSLGNSDDRRDLTNEYLGHLIYFSSTERGQSSALELFESDQQRPMLDGYYRPTCVVRKVSPFHSLQDIVRAANQPNGNVRFLFVRPYSVSGYIHPRYVLEKAGLHQDNNPVSTVVDAEFTMQHPYSLNTLLNPKSDNVNKDLVAFVLDQTSFDQGRKGDLRRIYIPELEKVRIPQELLLLSPRRLGEKLASVKEILLSALKKMTLGPDRDCDLQKGLMCFDAKASAAEWLDSYTEIVKETRTIPIPASLTVNAVLDDLVHEIQIYREKVGEPRLALVLSGGGAKCAYQAGALSAITARLTELQNEKPRKWVPEIKLVVGTSGGAINALFYALGLDDKLENIWRSFDQEELIRPPAAARILWGIFAGLTCVLIVFGFSLLFRAYWWRVMASGVILIAVVSIVVARLSMRGFHNHWLYHDMLLLRLSVLSACIVLVASAALVAITRVREAIRNHLLLTNIMGGLLVLSMLMLFADTLFFNEYLTDMSGAKEAFIGKLPGLVPDVHVGIQQSPTIDGKLKAISKIITESGSDFKRDLILTGARLPADDIPNRDCPTAVSGTSLPNDLYFYYDVSLDEGKPKTLPNAGNRRFISLRENPDSLLHVVLGSSTIYPFFGAQRLDCLQVSRPERNGPRSPGFGPQQQIRSIDIVDGGYSHNSPLDAAISWGATHILLIQASPSPHYERPHFLLAHIFNAFSYLFDQAQNADSSVKGNVEIFELAPSFDCDQWFDPKCSDQRQQWLDLLDFADPLLERAIQHGRNDVGGEPIRPHFNRIPGPPSFISASNAPSATPSQGSSEQ